MGGKAFLLTHSQDEDTVVLLLDSEKAYDCVDWGFLESILLRMGFRTKGIAALYSTPHSKVLINGDHREHFLLTRSMR